MISCKVGVFLAVLTATNEWDIEVWGSLRLSPIIAK